ncbi:type II toxin-antitoxin system Phd/YefM family antitoxin [Antrihabitans spumae]|jgi:prevent-host-death family protein|uniref:Type II toxin-antitoxin system Phd/YefM family antitoxin n=1 Tax=Antrihabitans spumae TaxID=3373370 RepID=A0ABW7JM55_9NOCA
MSEVNVRELRNHGGEVLDRVSAGESITVVRSGTPVAELRPIPARGPGPAELIRRRRHLPAVNPEQLKADLDAAVDASL